MIERTLVLVKPDGVERNLIGEVIKRYETAGLKVIGISMLRVSEMHVGKHYSEEEEYLLSLGKKSEKAGEKIKDYRAQGLMVVRGLRTFLTRGPIVAMVLEGENAIKLVRQLTGYTDPAQADKGTIRGDFGKDTILKANSEKRPVENIIHASGNPEEAEKEIKLWFKAVGPKSYKIHDDAWHYVE